MAKRKTEQVADPEEVNAANQNLKGSEELTPTDTPAEQVENPEEVKDPIKEPEKKETKTSKKSKAEGATTAQSKDIPSDVLKVLECFPNEDELYINKFGGVFTKDTEPSVVAGAILYKNPYYKS